jgi:hypothetical protein
MRQASTKSRRAAPGLVRRGHDNLRITPSHKRAGVPGYESCKVSARGEADRNRISGTHTSPVPLVGMPPDRGLRSL